MSPCTTGFWDEPRMNRAINGDRLDDGRFNSNSEMIEPYVLLLSFLLLFCSSFLSFLFFSFFFNVFLFKNPLK